MAISGLMTDANAGFSLGSLKHKVMNKVDPCNASACGSPKGLTDAITGTCLADSETATKHKNCSAAFWAAHCQGSDAATNQNTCEIALPSSGLPDGFACDADAAATPDKNVLANCFNPLGLHQNKFFAWTFWHHADNCKAQGKKKANPKYKTQCAAIKKVYAKIDTDKKPAAPTPPPSAAAEEAPTEAPTETPEEAPAPVEEAQAE